MLTLSKPRLTHNPEVQRKVDYLKSLTITQLWVNLLNLQNQYYLKQDFRFLLKHSMLDGRKEVGDFGCGTGSFMAMLAKVAPNFNVHGYDTNVAFVELGRQKYRDRKTFKFNRMDIFDIGKRKFNLISARNLTRHLNNQKKFMHLVDSHLKDSGFLYVLEALDSKINTYPSIDALKSLLSDLSKIQAKQEPFQFDEKDGNLSLYTREDAAIMTSNDNDKSLFTAIFAHFGEIAIRSFKAKVDLYELVHQLEEWKNNSDSYGEIGVSQTLIQKV